MVREKQPSGLPEKILDSAVNALLKWNNSSLTLDECINDIRGEKAAVSILFLYFRHKMKLDTLIRQAASKGNVKQPFFEIAACALAQALFQTGIRKESAVNIAVDYTKRINPRLGGFMNALLRSALRKYGNSSQISGDFPEKLGNRWISAFGKTAAEDAIGACAVNPPLSFRIRGPAEPPEGSHEIRLINGFRFCYNESPEAVLQSELFRAGKCYIQDPATALSVSLCGELPDHAEILDACAAPGGKTVMLADKYPDAVITAADKSEKRIRQMQENFDRMNLSVKTRCTDALEPNLEHGSFDLILADVPCTNTGVMRRRPDAAWRFSVNRLNETVKLQKKIMDSLADLVKDGGILLYSTCSVEPEEDSMQVDAFLKRHPEFTLEDSKLLLPDFLHDGAFAARLRKKRKSAVPHTGW